MQDVRGNDAKSLFLCSSRKMGKSSCAIEFSLVGEEVGTF